MPNQLVECVPNISEGRDQSIIDAISNACSDIAGAKLLGVEPDADYNRTVLTIAGKPDAVSDAAFAIIKTVSYTHLRAHET